MPNEERKKVRGFQVRGITDSEWDLIKKKCKDLNFLGNVNNLAKILFRQFVDDEFVFEFDREKQRIVLSEIKK